MNTPKTDERSYAAFISYRHLPLDREAAIKIQKRIENFVVPKEYRRRTGGKKLGLCFRDEDELPASASLSGSIKYALDHSQYLIVICTPQLQLSQWCMAEIQYFLQTHDRNHVLAVLADGSPEQSFPDMLRFIRDRNGNILANVEPLAANISSSDHTINRKSFKKESLRLCAAILGCPFDALWQREHRARTTRLLMAALAGFAVMAVIVGVVLVKNAQISEKNRELEKNLSTALVDTGISKLENYDLFGALEDALAAVEGKSPDIYDHRVEKLLSDALGAYSPGRNQFTPMGSQPTDIERLCASADGRIAFTADQVGNIAALDMTSGQALWNIPLNTTGTPWLYALESGYLLCKYPEKLTALSMTDGSVVWTYEYDLPNQFQVISDDQSLFAVLDWNKNLEDVTNELSPGKEDKASLRPESSADMMINVLDTKTGETVRLYLLPDDPYHVCIDRDDHIYDYGGDFSDDNSILAFALPTLQQDGTKVKLFLGTYDPGYQLSVIEELLVRPKMILGMEIASDNSSVYWSIAFQNLVYSIICYPEKETVLNSWNGSISSLSGFDSDYQYAERPYIPMLSGENLFVIILRNSIYLIDKKDGSLHDFWTLESPVVSAIWWDKETEQLELITENGKRIVYQIPYSTEETVMSGGYVDLPVEDISTLYHCVSGSGDVYGDYILAASRTQPGFILALNVAYDKDYKESFISPDTDCAFSEPTPSGDRIMCFFPDAKDETLAHVRSVDLTTGTVLEERAVSLAPFAFPLHRQDIRPLPTDDSHFLLYGRIYGLDGTVEEIGETPDDDQKYLAAVLENGELLYICRTDPTGESIPSFGELGSTTVWAAPDCYLNGRKMEECASIQDGIAMQYSSNDRFLDHFAVGKNGWIAGWGYPLMLEETMAATEYTPALYKTVVSEKMMLVAKNVKTGYKLMITEDVDEFTVTHMVLSNRDPYLAVVYDVGAVSLYDLKKQKADSLTEKIHYAKGEIQDICFSDSDRFLLILTVNGRIDCFDVETKELLFSLTHCFSESSADLIDRFYAVEETDNDRLVLIAANESGKTDFDDYRAKYWTTALDTVTWAVTLRTEDVCWWSAKHANAFIVTGRIGGICRIHTIEDLTEWARSYVGD
ncbi:MAG: TIR domain-containing protein [Firmicutes bacterium]|nr:TIR domain-containing protein [Bacillota bacterium]